MTASGHSPLGPTLVSPWSRGRTDFRERHAERLPFPEHDLAAIIGRQDGERTDQWNTDGLQDSSDAIEIDLSRYLPFSPLQTQPREFFQALQKWEGYVVEVLQDSFIARLTPILGEGDVQDAVIYLEEIDEDDQRLLEPGAIFYWSIGYINRPSGRMRVSILRLRRLPNWTKRELMRAEEEAAKLEALFADE